MTLLTSSYGHANEACVKSDDNTYRKLMIGSWVGTEEGPPIHGNLYIERVTFLKNGKMQSVIFNKLNPDDVLLTAEGNWRIENNTLYEK